MQGESGSSSCFAKIVSKQLKQPMWAVFEEGGLCCLRQILDKGVFWRDIACESLHHAYFQCYLCDEVFHPLIGWVDEFKLVLYVALLRLGRQRRKIPLTVRRRHPRPHPHGAHRVRLDQLRQVRRRQRTGRHLRNLQFRKIKRNLSFGLKYVAVCNYFFWIIF